MIDYECEYLTVPQAGELLQIRNDSVERLIKRGDIVAYKVGGAVRVDRQSIHSYLSRRVMGQGVKHQA